MNFRAHAFVASSLRLSAALALLLVGGCGDSERIAELEAEKELSDGKIAHLEESWMEVSDELVAKTAELNRLKRGSEAGLTKVQSLQRKLRSEAIALEKEIGERELTVTSFQNHLQDFLIEIETAKELARKWRETGLEAYRPPVKMCGVDGRLELPDRIAEQREKIAHAKARLQELRKVSEQLQTIESGWPTDVDQDQQE